MASRVFALTRLGVRERLALQTLRGVELAELPAEGLADFRDLRRAAMALGHQIRDIGCRYASDDEVRLLAWLTDQQRTRPLLSHVTPTVLLYPLGRCADRLQTANMRLNWQAVNRAVLALDMSVNKNVVPARKPAPRTLSSAEARYRRDIGIAEASGEINHARLLIEKGAWDEAIAWLRALPNSASPGVLDRTRSWLRSRSEMTLKRLANEI